MNYYVYVLESLRDQSQYVGSTGKDLEHRLKRHNLGEYRYTKAHSPWKIIYSENFSSRSAAIKRERYLKSGVGRLELKKLLQASTISACS